MSVGFAPSIPRFGVSGRGTSEDPHPPRPEDVDTSRLTCSTRSPESRSRKALSRCVGRGSTLSSEGYVEESTVRSSVGTTSA